MKAVWEGNLSPKDFCLFLRWHVPILLQLICTENSNTRIIMGYFDGIRHTQGQKGYTQKALRR